MAFTNLLLSVFAIYHLLSTVGLPLHNHQLSLDSSDILSVSSDFGAMTHSPPLAVLRPSSALSVASLILSSFTSPIPFTVSARGHGHSINGQAQTSDGVVVAMMTSSTSPVDVSPGKLYVDVWGGRLWIEVLEETLKFGLAPKSWTDYLYLTVGGTLSNAGISGQAFNYGPQISNVHELDVVTGKGEILTCSEEENSELFHGVLGGLGQFGIITRARIALEPAPQRVRWIRVLYSNFTDFTRDQEKLISLQGAPSSDKFDYVEGFVIVDEGLINNWRSSFFSPSNPVKLHSLGTNNGGVLYCVEMTKNYDKSTAHVVDQEVEELLKKLNYIPATEFTTDLPYIDFLDRVHKAELNMRAKNLWDVPHPWLNLFVPGSRIAEFDRGVFRGILGHNTSGPILIYPMNKNK
ncbi:Cytokinin dehydrogenase 5 [Acorus gramineus]|uniref:cytokinin dehydrogenase n=1 Tax=Acorus gramineus TaxID=55184 RepID=A0AAV9B5P5_ACOGR|nr:Cytokinin dehydrogenase 5 [Acorus gramineus]